MWHPLFTETASLLNYYNVASILVTAVSFCNWHNASDASYLSSVYLSSDYLAVHSALSVMWLYGRDRFHGSRL